MNIAQRMKKEVDQAALRIGNDINKQKGFLQRLLQKRAQFAMVDAEGSGTVTRLRTAWKIDKMTSH